MVRKCCLKAALVGMLSIPSAAPAVAEEARLTMFVNADLAGGTLTLFGENELLLDEVDALKEVALVRNYALAPGTYEIILPDQKVGLTLNFEDGNQYFLSFAPFDEPSDEIGTQLAFWKGTATPEIREALLESQELAGADFIQPVALFDYDGSSLYFNTEPPWPIPPRPDPPPPPQ